MSESKIPISAAKQIADLHDCNQIIVLGYDDDDGFVHVVTYGRTAEQCRQAAQGGNKIKREILGWPSELCNAKPTRTDF